MNYGSTTGGHAASAAGAANAMARGTVTVQSEDANRAPLIAGAVKDGDETDDAGNQQGRSVWQQLRAFYSRNIGLVLVFASQTFGSIMNTAARLLTAEKSANTLHALQIIFVRMLCTAVLGSLYMWFKNVPDFPFGPRGVRGLLVFRGTVGFVGLFGLYYSLSYLELSDATAITFLVPTWTAIVCYLWLREPYRFQEALSSLIALVGVCCIARPAVLFGGPAADPAGSDTIPGYQTLNLFIVDSPHVLDPVVGSPSSFQRTIAILSAVLNTVAAAIAYATIRVIGTRAHSLVSVNYFAVLSTVGSVIIILVHPDLHFVLPRGALQWTLLIIIGVAGFLLQFLLTEGLQREKGGRATNMIYIQMVFALIIERVIWGTTPPLLSLFGSALIVGSSVWVSLQKSKPADNQERTAVVDEESSLLGPERTQREES